tara:strand:+ start:1548 stop:1760 length:213 start_codon:yes stop_codon:yes gene_type:complete
MIDPYEDHPDHPSFEKKLNKYLTLEQISAIIDKEIEEILNWDPSAWGFTRDDLIETLEEVKEKMEIKCRS